MNLEYYYYSIFVALVFGICIGVVISWLIELKNRHKK